MPVPAKPKRRSASRPPPEPKPYHHGDLRRVLIEDLDATSFTPLFAINHHGVQIFAVPYASRMLSDTITE